MALISSLEKGEVKEPAKEIYEIFEKQGKPVPEWVKVMAHRPEILKGFFELFKVVMGKGEIKEELKWKIAYVVSQTLKCPFCVDVTGQMLKKFGADDKVLKQLKNLKGLSEKEEEILGLVKDVTVDGHLDNPVIFEDLRKKFSESQIVEIVSVIGLFNYINRFNNTLAILPE